MSSSTDGCVYVMYNEMFTYYGECYKIGCSNNVALRLQGYTTNFVNPCVIVCTSKQSPHYREMEKKVHSILHEHRLHGRREFFKCNIDTIKAAIQIVDQMTLDEMQTDLVEPPVERLPKPVHYCEFCQTSYETAMGLQLHKSKSHKDSYNSKQCPHCKIIVSKNYQLPKHILSCPSKKQADQLEKQIMLNIISTLKRQVNTPSARLMPVLEEDVQNRFLKAITENKVIVTMTDLATWMFSPYLQERVIKTDASRHVIKWIDADIDEVKQIRDPKGSLIASKIIKTLALVIQAGFDQDHRIDEVLIETIANASRSTINELGLIIAKMTNVDPIITSTDGDVLAE